MVQSSTMSKRPVLSILLVLVLFGLQALIAVPHAQGQGGEVNHLPITGDIVVLTNGFTSLVSSGPPHILEYDPATTDRIVVTCSPFNGQITTDPNECVDPWFPDFYRGRLGDLTVDANHHFVFTLRALDCCPETAEVRRLDPDNPNVTTTSAGEVVAAGGNLLSPIGVAIPDPNSDPNGDILVADSEASGGSGAVIRIDPVTGAQTVVSSGGNFVDPTGVTLAPSGEIFVTDPNAFGGPGAVIRVDPATGAQTVVSSGGHFSEPYGIALDAAGNILVADWGGPGAVIRVDPATGDQTVVSTGDNFENPRGVVVDANGDILVTDISVGLIRVDPVSRAQTMIDFNPDNNFQAVTIVPATPVPVITSIPVTEATATQPYTYQAAAIGDEPITWSLISGPEGMTVDASTGLVSWTPTESGSFLVQIQTSNAAGSDTQSYTISVAALDSVDITRAEYDANKSELRVTATSTDASATLKVFVTATNELIGTLTNEGDGKYRGRFSWPVNPENITVKSSLGGKDSADVTLK